MDLVLALLIATVCIALFFDYTNGFHDAANAIATSVSTQALTPRIALVLAAVMNFAGAFLGVKVAKTIADILVGFNDIATPQHALVVVMSALVGAIAWNLITWYFGLPSSSSHALIGGLVGVGVAAGVVVDWQKVLDKVAIPMVISPLLGFSGAFAVMTTIMWLFRRARPQPVNRGFRLAQVVSAAMLSLGHGLQDAQKTMGVIVLALFAAGRLPNTDHVPWYVVVGAAAAISLGTLSGGLRIMRTMGRRIVALTPPAGFAAELTASFVLYFMAIGQGAPVSTTHTMATSVMGAGASRKFRAVRWGVARTIVAAWIITLPMAGLFGALSYAVMHFMLES
ncbi:MAG TPA: inorganic phosphate transporter [Aeromicrobium sp.]|nr:inorganic phosphate transporter [Aeromicrobium sp.]HKY59196.1 inorganic phosphate transporter [Aeromicrobium sp.]